MAPKLIFTYFGVEGIAEAIRWALEQSGLEWEDKRLTGEEFGVLKPSLPNGQVHVLVVDGYVLPQTLAILRYVGNHGGLYPSEDLEAAKCDAAINLSTDFFMSGLPCHKEKDPARKMTVADLTIAHKIKYVKDGALDGIPTTIADLYPKVIVLYNTIVGEAKIAAFITRHAK